MEKTGKFTFTLKDDWRENVRLNKDRSVQLYYGGPKTAKAQIKAIDKLILSAEVIAEGEESTTYQITTV